MRRILALARKEVRHILRDPRSLAVAIFMPLGMLLLFGYALDMELRDLPVAVMDLDQSQTSRGLIRDMTSDGFIVDAGRLSAREEIESGFRQKRFRAALILPAGLESELGRGRNSQIQLIIDGSDAATAQIVESYMNAVISRKNLDLLRETFGEARPPLEGRIRFLFNPELRSPDFVVPGMTAVIMIMICALLTSVAVAREKETGTLEQILTTPIRPSHVLIGKVIPYMVIAAFDATLVLLVGHFVFKVQMAGSWWVLTGYSLLYLFISLAVGLFVSTLVKTQQIAMTVALVATMLPTLMLSGFLFPIAGMPKLLQWFAHIIPATYYLEVIRGVMLTGRAWYPVELTIMLSMGLLLMVVSAKKFQSRLDM